MAEEVKKIITVEVGKSITSVRDFKKHIEDLRGALLGLNEESEEYKTIAEQIATDQAKLNDVMKVGKTNTDSAAGSYVELNNQLKALRQQYKALSETERNGATGQAILSNITKLDTQLKDIDESMGQYQRNVGNYKQAFESVFSSVASEVGKINPTLGNLLSAVQKLVPAFKGVGTAAKATGTSIKSAMASTGIGLLVVALSEIITHWQEIYSWVQKVLGKQEDITKETGKTADELNRAAEAARNYYFNLNLAKGLTREEALEEQLNKDKKALDDLEYNMERAERWVESFRQLEKDITKSFWDNVGDAPKRYKKEVEDFYNTYSQLSIPLLETEKDIEDFHRYLEKIGSGDMNDANYGAYHIRKLFERVLEESGERIPKLKQNIEESERALDLEQTALETAAKKRGQEARKALMSEKELRKQRYDDEVADAKKRITNETELKETLEALEAEYLHDIQEMNERAWLSSDAYKQQQKDLNDRQNILERLHEYSTSELDLLEEKFAKEKKLVKGNGEAITTLTKEFMEKRHEIVSGMELNTIAGLTHAYEREIQLRKDYGLEYEDLERELQERINKIYQNASDQRIEKARQEMQRQMQVLNDATTQALHDASLIWTKNTSPNTGWNFWDYMFGKGQDNEAKIGEQLDTIFGIQEQQLQGQIQILNEYQSKLIEGSQEYIDIERQKTETIMELDNLRYEHAVELNDSELRMQERKRDAIKTIMSNTVSIYSSFTDMMLADEEQGSNRWKAFKTSEAVVNMLSGILAAFMSGFNSGLPAPWNIALATSTAGVAAAAGAAQIAQIQATKMGSTSSASNAITGGSAGAAVSPLLNPDYDLQRITNLSLQSDEFLPGKTQVYVLESDIQEVGNRVQVRENNATF